MWPLSNQRLSLKHPPLIPTGTLVPRRLALVIALLAASAATLHAQSSMSPREIHDRVVAVIRRRATSPLPSGDTSVTWYRGPILYHVVYAAPNGVRSGFLRNDTLVGKAEVG